MEEPRRHVDLVLRGATVVTASESAAGQTMDIAITGDRVVDVGPELQVDGDVETDCDGAMVLPGLIDLHSHVYVKATRSGIDVDRFHFRRGVLAVNDAGSAGSSTFAGFRALVADRYPGRVFAFLNASVIGIADGRFGELLDRSMFVPAEVADTVAEHHEVIRGIKIRLSRRYCGPDPEPLLAEVVELADRLELPVMVHIGDTDLSIERILHRLRADDVVTHCYTPGTNGTLTPEHEVLEAVLAAQERGLLFDVGHGTTQWEWDLTEKAVASGLVADTISSDLSGNNVDGPAFDLVTTMSKMLAVGMAWGDVVRATTENPARVLGLSERGAPLEPGHPGALSVVSWSDDQVAVPDGRGRTRSIRLLDPVGLVAGGHWHPAMRGAPGSRDKITRT